MVRPVCPGSQRKQGHRCNLPLTAWRWEQGQEDAEEPRGLILKGRAARLGALPPSLTSPPSSLAFQFLEARAGCPFWA